LAKYITSSTAIKMFNNGNTSMAIELRHRAYINERMLNRATFFYDAKRSYGKILYNRLEVLKELNFDWINMDNDDLLRVKLKKLFFLF